MENKSGFAISSMLYGIVFLGITIVLLLMSTMSFSNKVSNSQVSSIESELGVLESIQLETGNIKKTPTTTTVLTSIQKVEVEVKCFYSGTLDDSNLGSKIHSLVDGVQNGTINIASFEDESSNIRTYNITITGFTKNGALQILFDEGALVVMKNRKVRNAKTLLNVDLTKENVGYTVNTYVGNYDGNQHGVTINVTKPAENYSVWYGTTAGSYSLETSPTYANVGNYSIYYKITAPGYNSVTGVANISIRYNTNHTIVAAKGGTLTTSKNVETSTINYTTTASTNFIYAGSKIYCGNTFYKETDASTKSVQLTQNCDDMKIYPSWKRNDYDIFWCWQTNNTGGFDNYLKDGAVMGVNWVTSGGTNAIDFTSDGQSRGQKSTVNSYDLTDFYKLVTNDYCYNVYQHSNFTFYAGFTKNKGIWIHQNPSTNFNYVGWNYSKYPPEKVAFDGTKTTALVVDIRGLSGGGWYFGTEMYGHPNGYGRFNCWNDYARLYGDTYGYGHSGL